MTTPEQRERFRGNLATLMHSLRPDWEIAGCVAALRALPPDFPLSQVALCAMRYCGDDANRTPAMFADLGNRAWESDWYLPCKLHPLVRARRPNGECAGCFADRNEATTSTLNRPGVAPSPEVRRQLLDAISHRSGVVL